MVGLVLAALVSAATLRFILLIVKLNHFDAWPLMVNFSGCMWRFLQPESDLLVDHFNNTLYHQHLQVPRGGDDC